MKVLYFAQASTAAGCREEEWPASLPMTLETFWEEALRRHPALAAHAANSRVASGERYITSGELLDPTADAAVIPPVSGG